MKKTNIAYYIICGGYVLWQVSHELPFRSNKRNIDSLARTGQLPPEYKRSLASLAKSDQLREKLVQEKQILDMLEQANDENSKAIDDQKSRVIEVLLQNVFSFYFYNIKQYTYR